MSLNTLVFVLETLALTTWHFLCTTCKKISATLCQGNTVCDITASLAMQTHLKISKIPAGPWDIWLAFSLGMKVYETPLVNLESAQITKKILNMSWHSVWMKIKCNGSLSKRIQTFYNLWPNFGKSTIWVHLTHEIFSFKKQQLNSKIYLMMDSIYYRCIKIIKL